MDEGDALWLNISFGCESAEKASCRYEMRVLVRRISGSVHGQWSNALCEQRKELDIVGVGAYQDGRLIGLAGASRGL